MQARRAERARAWWAALATTALVGGLATAGTTTAVAVAAPDTAPTAAANSGLSAPPGGTYVPVTPSRVLDTRTGSGAPAAGRTQDLDLTVQGHSGVPTTGVSAVVLNVTVADPAAPGFVAVTPTGTTDGSTSNLNYAAGQDVAQLVVSGVSATGTVHLHADSATHLVADVMGWFTDTEHTDAGTMFNPVLTLERVFDSRLPGAGGALGNGHIRTVAFPKASPGTTAVMVNVTAVDPDQGAWVAAWPGGPWPGTSTLNLAAGDVRANRTIVPLGPDGTISLLTSTTHVDVLVDLTGYFVDIPGGYFVPASRRIVDSRDPGLDPFLGDDVVGNPRSVPGTAAFGLGGRYGLPGPGAVSPLVGVWATTTVIPHGFAGWTAFTPTDGAGDQRPPVNSSDVNWQDAVTPNVSILKPGVGGFVSVTSSYLPTTPDPARDHDADLVVDVDGYFIYRTGATVPGLWTQSDDDGGSLGRFGPSGDTWNHPVRVEVGALGDVVALASPWADSGVVLDRDGTVREWTPPASSEVTTDPVVVLDHDGAAVAAGGYGVFVVRTDGTVWTDSSAYGAKGVDGNVPGYGRVAGVSGAVAVFVSESQAWALGADGSVTVWATGHPPQPAPALRGPVRSLGVLASGGRQCTAYTDGTVDVLTSSTGTRILATGVDAVDVTAGTTPGLCWARDAAGHVTRLDGATGGSISSTAVPGPAAAKVVAVDTPVQLSGGLVTPDLRALGVDGVVRDLVDDRWVVEPGLAGATAIAGGQALTTYVPSVR